MIDYNSLTGVPFVKGARGPQAYDCYGLLSECHLRDGRNIPDYRSPSDQTAIAKLMLQEKSKWREIWRRGDSEFRHSLISPGNTILFSILGLPSHVGYALSTREFLHTWEKSGGVTVERISYWKNRIYGIYNYDEPSYV